MADTLEQKQTATDNSGKKFDSYTPWYAIWSSAFVLLMFVSNELDRVFNLYLLLVPIVILPGLILLATLVVCLGVNVFRQRWRRAISITVAPIIAASIPLLLGWLGITPQLIRFELWKSSYLAQVDALPVTNTQPRLKAWDWGETGGAAVANVIWVLVYDESDQIALPKSSRSEQWLRHADQIAKGNALYSVISPEKVSGRLNVSVQHLDGHFHCATIIF